MISPDYIVEAYQLKNAGFLSGLFGDRTDPVDEAEMSVAKDFVRRLKKGAVPEIEKTIQSTARKHELDENILNYVVYRNRQSWPVSGDIALALEYAVDVVTDIGNMQDVTVPRDSYDDRSVDAAVTELAKWAAGPLKNKMKAMLLTAGAGQAKSIRRKLNLLEHTPAEIANGLVYDLAKSIRSRDITFVGSSLIGNLIGFLIT